MKFKIVESRSGTHKTKTISFDEAKRLLRTKFSQAANAHPIYRGLEVSNRYPIIVMPSPNVLRPSANAYFNFYTMIINKSKAWSDFPQRQIIGSANRGRAEEYGNAFRVYPQNGAKIGICPESDIFESDFNDFNTNIANIFRDFRINPENLTTWASFVTACKKIDKMKIGRQARVIRFVFEGYDMDEYLDNNQSFLDYLSSTYYSPKKFRWAYIKDFKTKNNREVWTDSTCLLMPIGKNDNWIGCY